MLSRVSLSLRRLLLSSFACLTRMRSAQEGAAALVARAEGVERVQAVGVREQGPAALHLAAQGELAQAEPGRAELAVRVPVAGGPVLARAE